MNTIRGAEMLWKGAGDSITGWSDGRCQEPSPGPIVCGGGVTGEADRWRDNRSPGRRGKRWSHGSGWEQYRRRGEHPQYPRKIAGIAGGGDGKQGRRW